MTPVTPAESTSPVVARNGSLNKTRTASWGKTRNASSGKPRAKGRCSSLPLPAALAERNAALPKLSSSDMAWLLHLPPQPAYPAVPAPTHPSREWAFQANECADWHLMASDLLRRRADAEEDRAAKHDEAMRRGEATPGYSVWLAKIPKPPTDKRGLCVYEGDVPAKREADGEDGNETERKKCRH